MREHVVDMIKRTISAVGGEPIDFVLLECFKEFAQVVGRLIVVVEILVCECPVDIEIDFWFGLNHENSIACEGCRKELMRIF